MKDGYIRARLGNANGPKAIIKIKTMDTLVIDGRWIETTVNGIKYVIGNITTPHKDTTMNDLIELYDLSVYFNEILGMDDIT